MKLTKALKSYLEKTFGVAAGAADEVYTKAVQDRLVSGELTATKLAELLGTKDADQPSTRLATLVAETVKTMLAAGNFVPAVAPAPAPAPAPAQKTTEQLIQEGILKGVEEEMRKRLNGTSGIGGDTNINPHELIGRGASERIATFNLTGNGEVRVKAAAERYRNTKSMVVHGEKSPHLHLRGLPAQYMGVQLEYPSELDKAVIGAYTKWVYNQSQQQVPAAWRMSEHDVEILKHAMVNMEWSGVIGGDYEASGAIHVSRRKLTEFEQKSLLNDAISGGTFAVPVVYDDTPIITPILNGELFPLITVRTLAKGNLVRAFAIGNPTVQFGPPEGTATPLFDTSNFISGLDTTIYPATGAIEIGLDFEEDAIANIGAIVIERYGEKMKELLDIKIALGSGVNEPKGIFGTSGLFVVNSTNGAGGPWAINDVESLLFGLPKQFRNAKGGRNIFLMNELTYRRFRSIAVATAWNLRLFGMNYNDYQIMGYPVKIVASIPNNKVAFVNLGYYRFYRRQGMEVKVETGGKELTQKNLKLIVIRMRVGGQIELGGAVAQISDGQA